MKKSTIALLVLVVSGCAMFEGGEVPPASLVAAPDAAVPKPTVSYSFQAMSGLSEPKPMPEVASSIVQGELLAVLEKSGYFSRISRQDESADIKIDMTLTDRGNPAALIPAVITGLSLYFIPSWATTHLDLVANVERRDGLKKQYVLTDSVKLVQWLPMIFVFPAKNFSVIADVRKNMHTTVVADMRRDGFFEPQRAAPATAARSD